MQGSIPTPLKSSASQGLTGRLRVPGDKSISHRSLMRGPVRFLLPMKGNSALDAEGKPFFDEAADQALFTSLEKDFRGGADHRLIKLPHHINDAPFAEALVKAFREITEMPC